MNFTRFRVLLILLLISLISSSQVFAAGIKRASLTVYNSGQALVKETRSVNLPQGLAGVVFKDVPETIDPTSVHAEAKDMGVLDLQYSYAPITHKNILKRYVGKELVVILPDPADANGRVRRKATLLSIADKPVFKIGEEIYIGEVEGFLFPEMPKGLQQEPSLTLTTDSATAGKRDVLLSYLMGGLSWRADYTLSLDAEGGKGALGAWATIDNTSGRGFVGASLKLVAGDVNRAAPRRNVYAKATMMATEATMDAAPASPQAESFSQFHVYSVDRPVNLSESGTRQINLFSSSNVVVKEELVSTFYGNAGQQRGEIRQGVNVGLLLENTKQNGLGMAMPGGLVRVYRPTGDGNRLLAGEATTPHVGKGGKVRLSLGRAFDLSVRRKQTEFTRLGKSSYEIAWEISVTNGADKAQSITLRDVYSGEWEVVEGSVQHQMPDSGTLEFPIEVQPNASGKPLVVTYKVRITY